VSMERCLIGWFFGQAQCVVCSSKMGFWFNIWYKLNHKTTNPTTAELWQRKFVSFVAKKKVRSSSM
ncbi:MAG: hypothetical protein WCY66_09305, partial [Candidatus Cloacimonadales bacterium]